jgi:hypothetical protein
MRSSREHDMLEPLLETRVIILEIPSSFPPGRFRQRMQNLSHRESPITCNSGVTFKGARECRQHTDARGEAIARSKDALVW